MKKPFIKISLACLLTAILLLNSNMQLQAADQLDNEEKPLQKQAQRWVNELAGQPQFAQWKLGKLHISPLGPGTHSWLVLIKQQDQILGYMIIHASEEGGYQLGEYGTGEYPLFDNQLLQLSLLQLELVQPVSGTELLYIHPFLASWKVASKNDLYYMDGFNGEQLPVNTEEWNQAAKQEQAVDQCSRISADAALDTALERASFDPYERMPWLTNPPLKLDAADYQPFMSFINKLQLRYATERFNGRLLLVSSVTGYHEWKDKQGKQLFIALDSDGSGDAQRFIPLSLLLKLGSFYR